MRPQARLRRGRASPTPTGCTRGRPERPQGQGSPQGWTETPPATGDALTPSTGAQERHTLPEVVRGYPLTLSRSHAHRPTRRATGHDRRHRVRSIHPPRTDAPQSAERVEGHSYPPTAPRRATAAQDEPQRARDTSILNMYRGTAAEPETRTAQGVAGTPRKKSSEFEKKC